MCMVSSMLKVTNWPLEMGSNQESSSEGLENNVKLILKKKKSETNARLFNKPASFGLNIIVRASQSSF